MMEFVVEKEVGGTASVSFVNNDGGLETFAVAVNEKAAKIIKRALDFAIKEESKVAHQMEQYSDSKT